MRIVQMCRSLGAGGIEAIVCGLSNELVKTDDVTVCTLRPSSDNDLFYTRLDSKIKKESIGKGGESPLSTVFRVYKYLNNSRFDIVHIHGFFYFYLLAVILLHKKTRFVYTVHSDALKENNPWDLRLLALKRFCFKRKWIYPVTISTASKQSFTELYCVDSQLIMNGIAKPAVSDDLHPMDRYRNTPETKVFIHAGRISLEKNQGMMCVFDRLIKEGEDVSLVLAGPMHSSAAMDTISPFLSDRIHYIGESSQIPEMMHDSFGMCLTSFYEGLPVVLLEALSTGCIPVCTPVGGIVDIIKDGMNGFLSASISEDDYYAALKRLLGLSLPEEQKLRLACEASFSPFNISVMADNYLRYYCELTK